MSDPTDYLKQRNREIGEMIAQARRRENRSVTECAAIIGTSRRRYASIERGEAAITAAELELLLDYLRTPYKTAEIEVGFDDAVSQLVISMPLKALDVFIQRAGRVGRNPREQAGSETEVDDQDTSVTISVRPTSGKPDSGT